jgi:hypothetical protein
MAGITDLYGRQLDVIRNNTEVATLLLSDVKEIANYNNEINIRSDQKIEEIAGLLSLLVSDFNSEMERVRQQIELCCKASPASSTFPTSNDSSKTHDREKKTATFMQRFSVLMSKQIRKISRGIDGINDKLTDCINKNNPDKKVSYGHPVIPPPPESKKTSATASKTISLSAIRGGSALVRSRPVKFSRVTDVTDAVTTTAPGGGGGSGGGATTPPASGSGGIGGDDFGSMQKMSGLMSTLATKVMAVSGEITRGIGLNPMDIFQGVLKDSLQFITNVRMASYETRKWGDTTAQTAEQWAEFGSVARETGYDRTTFEAIYQKQIQKGLAYERKTIDQNGKIRSGFEKRSIKDQQKMVKTAVSTAFLIGSNAEETAEMFDEWQRHLGLSNLEMQQMSNNMKDIARNTGVSGDNLISAVKASSAVLDTLRSSGALTASAMANVTESMAIFQKSGALNFGQQMTTALSSFENLWKSDPKLQTLILAGANRKGNGIINDLYAGTILQKPEQQKLLYEGVLEQMQSTLPADALGNQMDIKDIGRELRIADLKGDTQKSGNIRRMLEVYGRSVEDVEAMVKQIEELKPVDQRINELQLKRQGAKGQEAVALDKQLADLQGTRRRQRMDTYFSNLKYAKNQGEALGFTTDELKQRGGEAFSLNELQQSTGDMVDDLLKRADKVGARGSLDKTLQESQFGSIGDLKKAMTSSNTVVAQTAQELYGSLQNQVEVSEKSSEDPWASLRLKMNDWNEYLRKMSESFVIAHLTESLLIGIIAAGMLGKAIPTIMGGLQGLKGIFAKVAGRRGFAGAVGAAGEAAARGAAGTAEAAAHSATGVAGGLADDAFKTVSVSTADDVVRTAASTTTGAAEAATRTAAGAATGAAEASSGFMKFLSRFPGVQAALKAAGSAEAGASKFATSLSAGKAASGAVKLTRGLGLSALIDVPLRLIKAYNIQHDTTLNRSEKQERHAENVGGMAGGLAGGAVGAKVGAGVGAGIGTFIFPGVGTAIGGAIGGIIGGIGGYFTGDKIGGWITKHLWNTIKSGVLGVSSFVSKAWTSITKGLGEAITLTGEYAQKAWSGVWAGIHSGIKGIKNGFLGVYDVIAGTSRNTIETVQQNTTALDKQLNALVEQQKKEGFAQSHNDVTNPKFKEWQAFHAQENNFNDSLKNLQNTDANNTPDFNAKAKDLLKNALGMKDRMHQGHDVYTEAIKSVEDKVKKTGMELDPETKAVLSQLKAKSDQELLQTKIGNEVDAASRRTSPLNPIDLSIRNERVAETRGFVLRNDISKQVASGDSSAFNITAKNLLEDMLAQRTRLGTKGTDQWSDTIKIIEEAQSKGFKLDSATTDLLEQLKGKSVVDKMTTSIHQDLQAKGYYPGATYGGGKVTKEAYDKTTATWLEKRLSDAGMSPQGIKKQEVAADATVKLTEEATKKNSIYTHDTHCEEILSAILAVLLMQSRESSASYDSTGAFAVDEPREAMDTAVSQMASQLLPKLDSMGSEKSDKESASLIPAIRNMLAMSTNRASNPNGTRVTSRGSQEKTQTSYDVLVSILTTLDKIHEMLAASANLFQGVLSQPVKGLAALNNMGAFEGKAVAEAISGASSVENSKVEALANIQSVNEQKKSLEKPRYLSMGLFDPSLGGEAINESNNSYYQSLMLSHAGFGIGHPAISGVGRAMGAESVKQIIDQRIKDKASKKNTTLLNKGLFDPDNISETDIETLSSLKNYYGRDLNSGFPGSSGNTTGGASTGKSLYYTDEQKGQVSTNLISSDDAETYVSQMVEGEKPTGPNVLMPGLEAILEYMSDVEAKREERMIHILEQIRDQHRLHSSASVRSRTGQSPPSKSGLKNWSRENLTGLWGELQQGGFAEQNNNTGDFS